MNHVCRLCLHMSTLRKSHVFPRAVFLQILRDQGHHGSMLVLSSNERIKERYSQDQWTWRLLCARCENLLNVRYEDWGQKILKGEGLFVEKQLTQEVWYKFDPIRFRKFLISILWRAAVSPHKVFRNVQMSEKAHEVIRLSLYNNTPMPSLAYPTAIYKLVDSTGITSPGPKLIKTTILAPAIEEYSSLVRSYIFGFYGYVFEFFNVRPPKKTLSGKGFLKSGEKRLVVPFREVTEFKPWLHTFVAAERRSAYDREN